MRINFNNKIKTKAGNFYLEKTSQKQVDDYIKDNPELGWLKSTFEGRLWFYNAVQNGVTLFVQNKIKTAIKYIFIDEPAGVEDLESFPLRYMRVRGLANQKIIKMDSEGKLQALAQVFMRNPEQVVVPRAVRKMGDSPIYMIIYYGGFKRVMLGYDDLENIYEEIKNKKSPYSVKTEDFLKCGNELGMVLDSQMGELAGESEFFKRFAVLFNRKNREHFIKTINDWTMGYDRNHSFNREVERSANKRFLIEEVTVKMKEKLDEDFLKNVHHGLQHSLDLLDRAQKLVDLLGQDLEIDWKVLTAAIYLHDIFAGESEFHGQKAAEFVDKNFKESDIFTKEQIEKIKHAVVFHDKKLGPDALDAVKDLNLETKLLYDIDNLDAFGIKGIYRYFSAHISRGIEKNKSQQQILDHIKQRVAYNVEQRRNNLYFNQSRQMAGNEFPMTKMFFDKLAEENYPIQTKKGATGVFTFIWENFQDKPWDIAEKAYNYFSGHDYTQDEEEMFTRLFFKRLNQVYLTVKQDIPEENNTIGVFENSAIVKGIDFMLRSIEESI